MPIEGSWNTVKAFFLTEARLKSPNSYNTFANGSLWYVQYFFGRETLSEQEGKCYLIQKPDVSNTSWMPSSMKTTSYFLSALFWTIPGIFARLISFDSKEVTSTIFADRITPPSPKTTKVPRPTSPLPPQLENNAVPAKELSVPDDSAKASSDSKEVRTPELNKALPPLPITSEATHPASSTPEQSPQATPPETPALEPLNNSVSAQESLSVGVAAKASTNINHYRILSELESSRIFFTELNGLPDKPRKVRDWLKKKEKESNYNAPFLFAHNLQGCLEKNLATIGKIIPEKALIEWQEAFKKAAVKLRDLKLLADGIEMVGEKAKPQKSIEVEHLDYIINFYTTFINLETNRAEWLEREILETQYRFPFFNALYFQGWSAGFTPPLDPIKLRFLQGYHKRCLPILYAEGLEHHLAEIPDKLSPGICALVHCMTANLAVRPPDQALKPSCKPAIDDAVLKPLLINGLAVVAHLPGIQAIFTNDRFFQRNKFRLMGYLDQTWENYIERFTIFLDLPYRTARDKKALQTWIDKPKKQVIAGQNAYLAQFSKHYKEWIDTLQPILSKSVYKDWNDLYEKCIQRLQIVDLLSYIDDPLPIQTPNLVNEVQQNEHILKMTIQFFKRFNPIPFEESADWLAQAASKKGYEYSFFFSFDLQCKMKRLEPHLNQAILSEWKALYEQACSKLGKLDLRNYLDEIPLNYVKDLFQSLHESLLSQFAQK